MGYEGALRGVHELRYGEGMAIIETYEEGQIWGGGGSGELRMERTAPRLSIRLETLRENMGSQKRRLDLDGVGACQVDHWGRRRLAGGGQGLGRRVLKILSAPDGGQKWSEEEGRR